MRQTVCVAEAFPIVIISVSILSIVVAVVVSLASGGLYDRIGRGGTFGLDTDGGGTRSGPAPGSAAARAEADAEIRQLVEAKSARRVARGESPLDVDAEVAALSRPAAPDADLRDEVRQLVIARNDRRLARGEEPLDVEAEVERQLRDLGG
jgi:hypothetical protein